MSEVARYSRRAKFVPKNRGTLRPEFQTFVGKVFDFRYAGVGGADEPYPGQTRWQAVSHDFWGWVPDEDLEDTQP